MPSSISSPAWADARRSGLRLAALWSGLLTGPLVWLALLELNYVLSYLSCATRHVWFLHAPVAAALLLVSASGLWAWRTGGASPHDRERWMARAGAVMSVFFLLVILSFEVPIVMLRPCV